MLHIQCTLGNNAICHTVKTNITNYCHRYHQKTVTFVAKVSDVHQIVFTVQGFIQDYLKRRGKPSGAPTRKQCLVPMF